MTTFSPLHGCAPPDSGAIFEAGAIMPTPHLNLLDLDALARIEHLELRVRRAVEGFIAGLHRSPFTGFSLEFASYREYQPGDDLKHLDWKAYARNDRYLIKQFESETNLTCHLVVDFSGSMGFALPGGRADRLAKADYARTVAACLAYLALEQSDAVSLALFGGAELYLPGSTRDAHLPRLCAELSAATPAGETGAAAALRALACRVKRRGLVVLISDLLDDAEAAVDALGRLAAHGHEVVALQVLDAVELDLPFAGRVRFTGIEGGGGMTCLPRQLRHDYRAAAVQYVHTVAADCRRHGADHHLLTTRTGLGAGLQAWLTAREHLAAGGRRR